MQQDLSYYNYNAIFIAVKIISQKLFHRSTDKKKNTSKQAGKDLVCKITAGFFFYSFVV